MRRALLGVALGGVLAFTGAAMLAGCGAPLQTETGIVLTVNGTSPSQIQSFTVRTSDGRIIDFDVGPVTFGQGSFPPEHLREHQALAAPVLVTYKVENGRNVAIKLADAPTG